MTAKACQTSGSPQAMADLASAHAAHRRGEGPRRAETAVRRDAGRLRRAPPVAGRKGRFGFHFLTGPAGHPGSSLARQTTSAATGTRAGRRLDLDDHRVAIAQEDLRVAPEADAARRAGQDHVARARACVNSEIVAISAGMSKISATVFADCTVSPFSVERRCRARAGRRPRRA